jgi:hypothetical protein
MNGDAEAGNGGAARVARTGIALVHEGELILPAAGSEAWLERAADEASAIVQYVFPVEIEVRNEVERADEQWIADLTLRRLTEGLRAS